MTQRRRLTRLFAKLVTGGGPYASLSSATAMVKDLRTQAARAPKIVGEISGMLQHVDFISEVPVLVVDRPSWVVGALDSVEAMFEGREGEDDTSGVLVRAGFSFLATSILGQYDPYTGEKGKLYLVAPNIAHFREGYNLDRRDLALWVAVHELTHALQFAAAPWLNDVVSASASTVLATADEGERKRILDQVTAVMSLLEGHATYVMDQVPIGMMPSRARLIKALAARRSSGSFLIKKLRKVSGVTKKAKQYTQGTSFTKYVVEAVGIDEFNRVWESEENLPTLAEIRDPQAWIDRVIA